MSAVTGGSEENAIQFRMGINIGDIIIEGEDIYGDGVNIAARLEGIAEAGGLSISEDAWRQIKGKIAVDFVDIGEKEFKNIARPVRVYRLDLRSGTAPRAAAASIGVAGKPAIAVLPFQNMSGDPEQEHFAGGVVEDIITGLSRIDWLFVIARNSSYVYKGKPVDVRQVGRELGVRYLLEGSVRKAGGRFRVTAQLIDAESGAHLWADKFDGSVDNVFDLQDRIAASVVEVVEPSLRQAEIERAWRKRPDDFAA